MDLRINANGRVLKGLEKRSLDNGTVNYIVPVMVEVPYSDADGKTEYQKTLLKVPVWRKEENVKEFESNAVVGAMVGVGMEMPFASVATSEKGELYGFFTCKKTIRFIFLGEKSEHYVELIGIGNVTADAKISDLKKDETRKAINFSLACNMREKDKDGNQQDFSVFVNCGMFRANDKTSIAGFIRKGGKLVAEGRPVVRTGFKADNSPAAYFNAEIYNISFVGKLPEASGGDSPLPQGHDKEFPENGLNAPGAPTIGDDDLPF